MIILICNHSYLYAQAESMMGSHNALLGKSGTAHEDSPNSSLSYNPAHISSMNRLNLGFGTGLQYYKYSYQYIGMPSQTDTHVGFDGIPVPTIVYPINDSLIFGGFIVPMPIPVNVKVSKVPIGLLGQLNFIDFDGKAKLNFFADIYANIFHNSIFAVAANINYISFEASIGVRSTGYSGDSLVDIDLSSSTFNLKLGLKAKLSSKITLGLSSILFSSAKTAFQMNSVLNEDTDKDGSPDPSEKVVSSSSTPIKNIRVGVSFKLNTKLIFYLDADYKRSTPSKQFSIVDLVDKEKDVTDTLGVFGGGKYKISSKYQILAGGFIEPSSVGPGGQGPDTKTGFGFMDIAMSLGSPPTTPAWGAGTGVRIGFMKKHSKTQLSKKSKIHSQISSDNSLLYHLSLDVGLVFSKVSIGVDESGEQPAVYDVIRMSVPIELCYTF